MTADGHEWVYGRVTKNPSFTPSAGSRRADVGEQGWIPLGAAGAGGPWVKPLSAVFFKNELVSRIRTGAVVVPDPPITVNAGDMLWTVGEYGSDRWFWSYRAPMIHWEIFSEENLMPKWATSVDDVDDYNVDCEEILKLIDQKWPDAEEEVTHEQIKSFYSKQDDDVKGLRRRACRFVSEWGIDLDKAVPKMNLRWHTSEEEAKERLSPYLWWSEVVAAGAPLREPERIWHYNPVAFMEAIAIANGAT